MKQFCGAPHIHSARNHHNFLIFLSRPSKAPILLSSVTLFHFCFSQFLSPEELSSYSTKLWYLVQLHFHFFFVPSALLVDVLMSKEKFVYDLVFFIPICDVYRFANTAMGQWLDFLLVQLRHKSTFFGETESTRKICISRRIQKSLRNLWFIFTYGCTKS